MNSCIFCGGAGCQFCISEVVTKASRKSKMSEVKEARRALVKQAQEVYADHPDRDEIIPYLASNQQILETLAFGIAYGKEIVRRELRENAPTYEKRHNYIELDPNKCTSG